MSLAGGDVEVMVTALSDFLHDTIASWEHMLSTSARLVVGYFLVFFSLNVFHIFKLLLYIHHVHIVAALEFSLSCCSCLTQLK